MNSNPHNATSSGSGGNSGPDCGPDCGNDTLRLIAGLPAPAGLEERVHEARRAAPHDLRGGARVLAWPARLCARTAMENHWMRAAAAAAIVFVVVGGGWGVYSRVEPGPAGKVIAMPQLAPRSGGISGAIRVPATIPGPTVTDQETKGPVDLEAQPAKKPAAPKKFATGQHKASAPAPLPAASQ